MQWLKNCGKVSGALMRESGAQTACRWGWDADFCIYQVIGKQHSWPRQPIGNVHAGGKQAETDQQLCDIFFWTKNRNCTLQTTCQAATIEKNK